MQTRKFLILGSILVAAVLLYGCSKRPTATTDTSTTAQTAATVTATTDTSGQTVPATPATSQANQSTAPSSAVAATSVFDITAVDTAFQKNFTASSASAKATVGNSATFCSAKVVFVDPSNPLSSDQYFYFSSQDDKLKDWYWVVYFDQTAPTQAKRLFAAKRDFSDITCSTATTPPSFGNSYSTLLTTYKDKIPQTSYISKTTLVLQTAGWKLDIWQTDGTEAFSKQLGS